MDEKVAERYRQLVQTGFEYAGSIHQPTLVIDTRTEGISICAQAGKDYMNIFFKVDNGAFADVKYLCSCDPTANVIIETLCSLATGKTLQEARALTKEDFFRAIGSDGGGVRQKVWGTMELLNRVINRCEALVSEA